MSVVGTTVFGGKQHERQIPQGTAQSFCTTQKIKATVHGEELCTLFTQMCTEHLVSFKVTLKKKSAIIKIHIMNQVFKFEQTAGCLLAVCL